MGVVGRHPEIGVRVVLERPHAGGPPWKYTGEAATRDACFSVAAMLAADGGVTVDLQPGAPAGLADKVRLIIRTGWKHSGEQGTHPPRRLVRWRVDR
ncbi:MAG: hypothetical protein M3O46_21820 [Myxococcota bacterium]|nr:hypothetical protein [Myxococcota bacterium]